ncbi:hypothetical protein [Spirillospora albida]|uniref:hypothetical protein n=1 Tax=Spirillospora albida TaxID=58123 RepID=UPI0004C25BE5|nr:hypothetical protein [Spirillospora albida]
MTGGLLVGPFSGPAAAATPDTTRNSTWTSFVNNSDTATAQWSGGDGTIGVKLPDGRVSFAFSDTMRGPVTPEGFHPPFQTAMVANSMVIASSSAAGATLRTVTVPGEGNNWNAKPLVPNTGTDNDPPAVRQKRWAGDGIIHQGQLVRFYTGMSFGAEGCYVFSKPKNTVVAKFSLPSGGLPALQSTEIVNHQESAANPISWGTALLNDGGYTYIYGVQELWTGTAPNCTLNGRRLHIARVPTGQFGGTWQIMTPAAGLTLANGLFSEFSVAKLGSTYLLVTQNYGSNVVAYASSTPTAFSGAATHLYSIPNYKSVLPGYAARMQPALTTSSEIVLSYNMLTSRVSQDGCLDENTLDASIYRPRFVRVPRSALPTAASAARTATASPAPAAISQRPHLAWRPAEAAGTTGRTATSPAAMTAAPGTVRAAVAASVPIPVGSINWIPRALPGDPPTCGLNVNNNNHLTAEPYTDAEGLKARIYWDYKGPTVDTSIARQRPGEDWTPLPLMLLGASPLPAVPAIEGPPLAVLSGSPQRIRWTDAPMVFGGQTVKYRLCMRAYDNDPPYEEHCSEVSVTL